MDVKYCVTVKADNIDSLRRKVNAALSKNPSLIEIQAEQLIRSNIDHLRRVLAHVLDKSIISLRSFNMEREANNRYLSYISRLIEMQPAYIELEHSYILSHLNLIDKSFENNVLIIASHYDREKTPDSDILGRLALKMLKHADIIRIVTRANSFEDNIKVLGVYDILHDERDRIIAYATGEIGVISRLDSVKLGAPFIYVSVNNNNKDEPGQLSIDEARRYFALFP